MAHLVESMMYFGAKPWHGLGIEVPNAVTSLECIEKAKLNWEVKLAEMFLNNGQLVEERKAVVRNTDNKILGTVGNRYTPLQNNESFNFFDSIIQENLAVYHTAGSLDGGKKIWILAKMPDYIQVKGQDIVEKFLLLSNSHDGSSAVQCKFTPIRVVCANTLRQAISSSERTFNVRHTASVADKIKAIKNEMNIINSNLKETTEAYQFLASKQVSQFQLKNYFSLLIPDNEKAESHARTENKRAELSKLFDHPTNRLPETAGTWWAAYNSVTYYLNHQRSKDQNQNMKNLWFGDDSLAKLALENAIMGAQGKLPVNEQAILSIPVPQGFNSLN